MRRHPLLIAAAAAACLVLASCGSSGSDTSASDTGGATQSSDTATGGDSSPSSDGSDTSATDDGAAPSPGGPIITRFPQDAGTLDPALSTVGGQIIDGFLYDPLVHFNLDGSIATGIATSWDVQPDSATFTLRDDVACTDGHIITPTDVKATYDYLKDPDTHATWIVSQLGTTDYTVDADDAAGTVTINLPEPFGDLLMGVAQIGIVCPDGLANPESLTDSSDGTGPFVVQSATPDVEYVLTPREGYVWGPDGASTAVDGFPSELTWKIVTDDATAVNMFTRGELNLLSLGGSEAGRLANDPNVTKTEFVASQATFMVFNQLEGRILNGQRDVREALAKASNRDELALVATDGLGQPANSLVNQDPKTCQDPNAAAAVPSFDMDAANAMLDAAGWVKGADGIRAKDGEKLSVKLLANDVNQVVWEYLQQAWSSGLGIDAEIDTVDNNSATERLLGGGDWDLGLIRIVTNTPSVWIQFFSGPQPPDGLNFGSGGDEYSSLAEKAKGLPGDEGCALWEQAEIAAFKNMDIFPLYSPQTQWFGNNVDFVPVWDDAVEPMTLRAAG